MNNKVLLTFVFASISSLSGCSSHPGTSDLSAGLSDFYSCPVLEAVDVRKDNGREADDQYLVEFNVRLAFKGGEGGAKKFWDKYIAYDRELAAKEAAIRTMPDQYGENFQRAHDAEMDLSAFRKSFRGLDDCSVAAQGIVLGMATAISQSIQQGQGGPVHFPVAVPMHGTAAFIKTEKGWVLAAPPNVEFDHFENSSSPVQL